MRKLLLLLIPFALFAQGRKFDHYTMDFITWRTTAYAPDSPWWKFQKTVKVRVDLPQKFMYEPSCHVIDDSDSSVLRENSVPPMYPVYDKDGRFQQVEIIAPPGHWLSVICQGVVLKDKPIQKKNGAP